MQVLCAKFIKEVRLPTPGAGAGGHEIGNDALFGENLRDARGDLTPMRATWINTRHANMIVPWNSCPAALIGVSSVRQCFSIRRDERNPFFDPTWGSSGSWRGQADVDQ